MVNEQVDLASKSAVLHKNTLKSTRREKWSDEEYTVLLLLSNTFFNSSLLSIEVDSQGQKVLDNGLVVLGARAGPDVSVLNLLHEMGHFLEIPAGRVQVSGWGLGMKNIVERFGRSYYDPKSWQCTQREIRVSAYQLNLAKYLGVEANVTSMAKIITDWMPDTYLLPCGSDDRVQFVVNEIQMLTLESRYSIEVILESWNSRVQDLTPRISKNE
jgi:hypothetical protein